MSTIEENLRQLGEDGGPPEDVYAEYERRYGRGASRKMAEDFGTTMRSIQRAKSGRTRKPKFLDHLGFKAAKAARIVREATRVSVGRARVEYDGVDAGERNLGDQDLTDPFLREQVEAVAGALDGADYEAAADYLNGLLTDGYGASNIDIADLIDGLRWS